jgi:hypothetical protein
MRVSCPRLAAAAVFAFLPVTARAQVAAGTAFTFQGRLDNSSLPANGTFDLQFKLFDAATGGTQQGATNCLDNVAVNNGLITATLDFGAVYTGPARWVEISARPDSTVGNCTTGTFTTLSPRQALAPAPYSQGLSLPASAFQALNGSGAAVLSVGNLSTDGGTYGIRGQTSATNNGAAGVYGLASAGGFAATHGVLGVTTGTVGDGVLGQHNVAAGVGAGVHGTTISTEALAVGVLGESLPTASGMGVAGVVGSNNGLGTQGFGVWGKHAGSGYGVYGTSPGGVGVYGYATASTGTNYGVFGHTNSSSGFAGYFSGNVETTGLLNVDGNITHPYVAAGPQTRCTPIAYGVVTSAGAVSDGSGNWTVSWNATTMWYVITITGENYFYLNDTTVVTPAAGTPLIATTNSASGTLLVELYNLSGTRVQGNFSFAVFRP